MVRYRLLAFAFAIFVVTVLKMSPMSVGSSETPQAGGIFVGVRDLEATV